MKHPRLFRVFFPKRELTGLTPNQLPTFKLPPINTHLHMDLQQETVSWAEQAHAFTAICHTCWP